MAKKSKTKRPKTKTSKTKKLKMKKLKSKLQLKNIQRQTQNPTFPLHRSQVFPLRRNHQVRAVRSSTPKAIPATS